MLANDRRTVRLTVCCGREEQPSELVRIGETVPLDASLLVAAGSYTREGRNETGVPLFENVPLLGKLPYLNRMYRNVGVGREHGRILLLVTPRLVIQEEEEERLGPLPTPPRAQADG